MSQTYRLKFEKPAVLEFTIVDLEDNHLTHTVDIFEAWDLVAEADKEPSEKAKWELIRGYIAKETAWPSELLTRSVVWEFRETVIKLGKEVANSVSKKLEQMLSLPQPTLESPLTTQSGQTS